MTKLLLSLGVTCALLGSATADAATIRFTSVIDGPQADNCQGTSGGTGSATFTLDTTTFEVNYEITFSGLEGTETVSHVHGAAPPCVSAGVVYGLPLGSPKIGSTTLTEAQVLDMLAGEHYVNIHSTVAAGGEIRGQILAETVFFTADIDGFQAVNCAGTSPGTGSGLLQLDTITREVSYDISFGGMIGTETISHVHGAAAPCTSAGVVYGLPLGSPKVGTATITEAQMLDMINGLHYVNIHSSVVGSGEIRGQVLLSKALPCAADIAGPGGKPDGNVDSLDFLLLIGQWGTPCVGTCEADITGATPGEPDGNVDSLDFLLLISQWGNPGNCPLP